MSHEEVNDMTTNTKCYDCVLSPNTCMYRCGLAGDAWEFVRRDVCCETHDLKERCRRLAHQKAVTDWTELEAEIQFLELELERLLELGDPDADYQAIISLLSRDYQLTDKLQL